MDIFSHFLSSKGFQTLSNGSFCGLASNSSVSISEVDQWLGDFATTSRIARHFLQARLRMLALPAAVMCFECYVEWHLLQPERHI